MVLYGDGSEAAVMETVTALRGQMLRGKLHPATLNALLYYRYGKPKETIELTATITAQSIDQMSDAEALALLAASDAAMRAMRGLPPAEVLQLPDVTGEIVE